MYKIKLTTNKGEQTVSINEIMKALNLDGRVLSVSLILKTNDRGTLIADAYDDGEYAGISIDGHELDDGKEETNYYLANAELPNVYDDTPVFTGRLYAGNAKQETDSPVVVMPYGSRTEGDKSKRVVFYDDDFVTPLSDKHLNKKASTIDSLLELAKK